MHPSPSSASTPTSTTAPDATATDATTTPTDATTTSTSTTVISSTSAASTTTPETTLPAQSSGYLDGAYLGTAEYTEWGDVQVQVTVSDGAIVDVEAVRYPTGRRSSEINNQAIPMLEAEAIAVQSADLDIVSGATYTSRTYADSLQAALDQAALAAAQGEATS